MTHAGSVIACISHWAVQPLICKQNGKLYVQVNILLSRFQIATVKIKCGLFRMKEAGTLAVAASVLADIELMLNRCITGKGCFDFADTPLVTGNLTLCCVVF